MTAEKAHRWRVAVVGAGALGLYYGARLARAGHAVTFLAPNGADTLRQRNRIDVRERSGVFAVEPIRVATDAKQVGAVDLVLITLKATANAVLATALPPLVGAETWVVTLQNGLGSEEAVAAIVGEERLAGGLCFIGVNRLAPGVVEGVQSPGRIDLGEYNRPAGAVCHALADTFSAAGVPTQAVGSLREARWRKLVWNLPFNGLTVTGGGLTCDVLLRDPVGEARVRALMREVQAAAAADGVVIEDEFLERNVAMTRSMAYKPSTLIDHLAGRPLELEPIWGEPLRRAQAMGVGTPELGELYAQLKALTV